MSVRGTCTEFTPKEEAARRFEFSLVSQFEDCLKLKYGEPILFKPYERSAAGKTTKSDETRTFHTLKSAIYILTQDLPENAPPSALLSDCFGFISDRIRSVCQDFVIQPGGKRMLLSSVVPVLKLHYSMAALLASEKSFSYTLYRKSLGNLLSLVMQGMEEDLQSMQAGVTEELVCHLLVGYMESECPAGTLRKIVAIAEHKQVDMASSLISTLVKLHGLWHSQQWKSFQRVLRSTPLWVRIALHRCHLESCAQVLRLWAKSSPKSIPAAAHTLCTLSGFPSSLEVVGVCRLLGVEVAEEENEAILHSHRRPLPSNPMLMPPDVYQDFLRDTRSKSKGGIPPAALPCKLIQMPPQSSSSCSTLDSTVIMELLVTGFVSHIST